MSGLPTPTALLDLLRLAENQQNAHATINEDLARIDANLHLRVLDQGLNTPPGSPSEGDAYIIGAAPTGVWATHANEVAYYYEQWYYQTPFDGMRAYVVDESSFKVYESGAWSALDLPLTTAGDLGVHNGSGVVREPIGANDGRVLTVATANPTKVAWSFPGGMNATGDMLYMSGATTITRLGAGSEDQFLRMSGGVPVWETVTYSLDGLTDVTVSGAAKGEILAYTGATWTQLGAGVDGEFLIADSAETTGLRWGSPSTPDTAIIGGNASHSLSALNTPVEWGAEIIDPGSFVTVSGAGGRTIQITQDGDYLFEWVMQLNGSASTGAEFSWNRGSTSSPATVDSTWGGGGGAPVSASGGTYNQGVTFSGAAKFTVNSAGGSPDNLDFFELEVESKSVGNFTVVTGTAYLKITKIA